MSTIGGWDGPKIVKDRLVLYLDVNSLYSYPKTGTIWKDLSGNGYNGTLINGPTYNADSNGNILFDGVNDYVVMPVIDLRNTDFTYDFWFRFNFNGNKDWLSLWSQQNGLFDQQFAVRSQSIPKLAFWYSSSNKYGNTSLIENTWYQGVMIYRHVDYSIKFYLNGVADSAFQQITKQYTGININCYIGSWTTSTQLFGGNIAIARIYKKLLSDDEILKNFNATKKRFNL